MLLMHRCLLCYSFRDTAVAVFVLVVLMLPIFLRLLNSNHLLMLMLRIYNVVDATHFSVLFIHYKYLFSSFTDVTDSADPLTSLMLVDMTVGTTTVSMLLVRWFMSVLMWLKLFHLKLLQNMYKTLLLQLKSYSYVL